MKPSAPAGNDFINECYIVTSDELLKRKVHEIFRPTRTYLEGQMEGSVLQLRHIAVGDFQMSNRG